MQINTTACCVPEVGVHTYNGQQLATAVNWVTKGALAPFNDHLQDPVHILVYISSEVRTMGICSIENTCPPTCEDFLLNIYIYIYIYIHQTRGSFLVNNDSEHVCMLCCSIVELFWQYSSCFVQLCKDSPMLYYFSIIISVAHFVKYTADHSVNRCVYSQSTA